MEKETEEKRGVALKVLGVSLFIIGSLNTMLCWRGGLPMNVFSPSVMVVGITLFIIGTIRGTE